MINVKQHVINAFKLLANPKKGFESYFKKPLDVTLSQYFSLLLLSSILAFASVFLLRLAKSFYYHFFKKASVNYWGVLNLAGSTAVSVFFLYLFLGTFVMFVLNIVLYFIFKRLGFVNVLKLSLLSYTPILVFGWIPVMNYSLTIWAAFLFITGLKAFKNLQSFKKR
ncbi:hypothetical protein J7L02_02150 [Candidatus Woesearchaeota archaeon]|nr:hypothetical protein [Candidatus Woesearchaeota archaeon]